MASKVVLITGANTGIGFQIVRALCSSSHAYDIVVGGRSEDKVQAAIEAARTEYPETKSKLSPVQIDIESDESINRAFNTVESQFGKIDVLVNNAGAQFDQLAKEGKLSEREAWNQSWNVNTSGTQVMTTTFIPLLLQSSDPRLLFITSGTSTLAGSENQALAVNKYPPKGWPKSGFGVPAYRSAKTGMNMLMREWHKLLHEDDVKVFAISPGFLATGLGGNTEMLKKMGGGDPEIAGPFIKSVIEGERDADAGKVITKDGIQPW
ncbi:hypothetical protein HBI56_179580 [Parastagonospora nodorum]|uniref:Uncharacterized protein n=2 Tax=Phaeosphaeria nodorum (strain SN15 / ATCC MYA-4574 / FGSC 10173) TaxID=321614 RepID=A0A7U2HVX1_PHANO|nr:hypothetical protein SNOG_08280 [Parastagonospora nodorum SN15]KAH3917852.1 hypothetical protein HBH56_045680 [Parastagonospora nodorum]EAT84556.2 hypothetical protein SNOG_08280 [Parastagonospora nodorum SN15]KAH3932963.1 hypothetical protein HBH54_073430 [Parastagonospora nodorum]KAH3946168.1 hypothetical protein HBH53_132580 [Parastagonospora nodorum]KAH3973144.1 hypothetical protein HBH52_145480 [Parastagonospora nodorum]